MERVKSNKYALLLFIAAVVIAVFTVLGIVVAITGMNVALDTVKREAQAQGYSQAEIDAAVNIARGAAYFALIIVAVIELFVILCGLKCSMQGKWRTGAIVFGVLLLVGSVFSVTQKTAAWTNWIDLVLGVFYLVGAIMCKPDAPVAQNTTSAE